MKLTIDTAQLPHWWRRCLHRLRGRPIRAGRCGGCGVKLTESERHYYVIHCEQCTPQYTWSGE